MKQLTADDFQMLIGDSFKLTVDGNAAQTLDLLEASSMGTRHAENYRNPFSLLFRGKPADTPEQGIFTLSHPKLGELQLFLVPVGPDQDWMLYEAIFN